MVSRLSVAVLAVLAAASGCELIAGVKDGELAATSGTGASNVGSSTATGASSSVGGMGGATSGGGGGAAPRYEDVVLADGPVGYWRLDDPDPIMALDSSPSGHHGFYSGTLVLLEPGALPETDNRAVFFTGGASDYVEIADVLDLAGEVPMTVEAWIKQTDLDGTVVAKANYDGTVYRGWLLVLFAYEPRFIRTQSCDSTVSVDPMQWSHVVGRFDGGANGSLRTYVNGVETAVRPPQGLLDDTTNTIRIGTSDWGSFDGWIDEVAVYDKALSVQRIQAHYDAGRGVFP